MYSKISIPLIFKLKNFYLTPSLLISRDVKLVAAVNLIKKVILWPKNRTAIVPVNKLYKIDDHGLHNADSWQLLSEAWNSNQSEYLKGASENRRNVKRDFSIVRIGQFQPFWRVRTQKTCGISWVIIKKLWNENSVCQLTQISNLVWNFC